MKKQLLIGCSGYYYPEWKNKFYPVDLPSSKWLEYYSSQFNTVELNSTFYRLPKPENLKKYAKITPGDFKFSVKVNRFITHILRLKESKEKINEFTMLVEKGLGNKLQHLLFQLPPSFAYTPETMEAIIKNIPANETNIIELRHASWWNKEVFDTFKTNGYNFCSVDFPNLPNQMVCTSDIFYLRLHGTPVLFKSSYDKATLETFFKNFPVNCKSYSVYFNNTYGSSAYLNAPVLQQIAKNAWH